MKYAISSTDTHLRASLDPRFGRCKCLVTYDTENGAIELLPNPFYDMEEGVGPKMVELVVSKNVNRIISGSFGLKIKSLLDSHRIQMIIPENLETSVNEIIDMLRKRNE